MEACKIFPFAFILLRQYARNHKEEAVSAHFEHSESTSAYDVDKTSEAASSIPSLVEEVDIAREIKCMRFFSVPTSRRDHCIASRNSVYLLPLWD